MPYLYLPLHRNRTCGFLTLSHCCLSMEKLVRRWEIYCHVLKAFYFLLHHEETCPESGKYMPDCEGREMREDGGNGLFRTQYRLQHCKNSAPTELPKEEGQTKQQTKPFTEMAIRVCEVFQHCCCHWAVYSICQTMEWSLKSGTYINTVPEACEYFDSWLSF